MNTWALTTVARYKTFAGITGATYDTKIGIIIDVVTDFIEKFCDRRFFKTIYTDEVYDGLGSPQLLLRNYPVVSASAFTLSQRDTPMNENQWSSLDTNLYHVDYLAGLIELIDARFSEYPRHYKVTYTAGYAFDNTTPGATLESLGIGDLEYACWQMISNIFNTAGSQTGIDSESIGNYSVSYGTYYLLDPEVKMIINKYKRPHLM